nr:zinc finger protein 414 isoform X1 [Paramormyrops kingsleyae]
MSELERLLSFTSSSLAADSHEPEMSAGVVKHEPSAAMEGGVLPCSYYGCKRTFTDVQKLNSHTESHQIPTESLPGKAFQCSSVGCSGVFPNMQQLMEHMRSHYKPNHYFLCESCRAKLRSYQALLKHLHTCAKVAKNKVVKAEPDMADGTETAPDAMLLSAGPPEPPDAKQGGMEDMQVDPGPPATPRDSRPGSAATAAPLLTVPIGGLPPDGPLAPAPGTFPLLEPPPFSQQSLIIPRQPQQDTPPMPFPAYQTPMQSSPPPSYGQHQLQQQQRLLRTAGPAPPGPLAPPASPGSNAVWRKNQGQSFSSRILWEHTRGRYRCLQCSHSTPTRQEMTAHIEGHHKGPAARLQGDVDFRVVPPFQPKSSPDGEPSVYTQL